MNLFQSTLATRTKSLYFVAMRRGTRSVVTTLGFAAITLFDIAAAFGQVQTAPAAQPGAAADAQPTVAPTGAAAAPPTSTAQPVQASQPSSGPVPASNAAASTAGASRPPEPPSIDLHKDPPLPPPVERTDHTHDGFYARLSLGFGSMGTTMNAPESGAIEGDGSSLSVDIALGYAVRPGIILGATLMWEQMPSVQLDALRPVTSDVSAGVLGAFFDGYPNARGGFHLGGALGLASTNVQRVQAAGFDKAGGFGIAGWVGYDVWVAEQWSAGISLRMMGTRTKADAIETENNLAGNATMATKSIALMLTGVYN